MKRLLFILLIVLASLADSYAQEKYLGKGNQFLSNQQFEDAERTFREAVQSDPDNLIYQNQLGLSLVKLKKYNDAQRVLDRVLQKDSNNVAANWYSGISGFSSGQDRIAIGYFERAMRLINRGSGQYYSANWFVGKCYANLLKTEGLTYDETDRMFACFEEYLRLLPNAKDAQQIRSYVDRKKQRRPPSNVKVWVDL